MPQKLLSLALSFYALTTAYSLLSGCPHYLINKLQTVQNNAVCLVLRVSRTDHISPHLASLHWLPTDSQRQYKVISLCYTSINSTVCLTELLKVDKPTNHKHSYSDTSFLCLPSVCMQLLGQRKFSYAAPSVWNSLPCKVRSSNTLTSFKSS